tara:strand:+ start:257 stop:370 length:114 start_codon:yes stop_codon:yes gene_type:complete
MTDNQRKNLELVKSGFAKGNTTGNDIYYYDTIKKFNK